MFSAIKRFVCRHRRKLIVSGVVIGGVVFATHYAQRKLREWQEREMKEFLERTQRQQHFERNERTCNQTILSLTPSLCDTVGKLLNTEEILEKLRNGKCDKVAMWEELKIIAFTRLSVLLYSGTLLVIMLRIQVNLIGGYLYRQLTSNSEDTCVIGKQLQEDYLSLCEYFLTKGIKELSSLIETKVRFVLEGESLKKQLNLQDIERYFWAIQSAISSDSDDPLSHLSKYILPQTFINNYKKTQDKLMCQIITETLDIIETDEVKSLATSCISRGFSQIMDKIAEFYVPDNLNNQLELPGPSSRVQNCHISKGLHLNKVTMPMAKVVPIVNGLTNMAKANGSSKESYEHWIQQFINLQNIKILGANIYESFSNPLS
ncbi:peroxisomal biogenesis factor 3 [Lycorma delicatula]|uniref:peroxisomal biogenesis factor 3 n=1 Tax=Lycorma delicatula TaxID=130591 RepID=UPI003F51838F